MNSSINALTAFKNKAQSTAWCLEMHNASHTCEFSLPSLLQRGRWTKLSTDHISFVSNFKDDALCHCSQVRISPKWQIRTLAVILSIFSLFLFHRNMEVLAGRPKQLLLVCECNLNSSKHLKFNAGAFPLSCNGYCCPSRSCCHGSQEKWPNDQAAG
jgi:hypothetical protein